MGVTIVAEVIRGSKDSPLMWAEKSPVLLQRALICAGLLGGPLQLLQGVSLRELQVSFCDGRGWVKATLEGGNERSKYCKSWRLTPSFDVSDLLHQMRAWGLSRQALTAQLELPWGEK
jgi:hypothetical protein